ncbi:MAG: hypothetical protein JW717_04920 [Marinilabiliaceae bacterium]|nr:hypothetical protein [Marinilabiliaceae bacterium]
MLTSFGGFAQIGACLSYPYNKILDEDSRTVNIPSFTYLYIQCDAYSSVKGMVTAYSTIDVYDDWNFMLGWVDWNNTMGNQSSPIYEVYCGLPGYVELYSRAEYWGGGPYYISTTATVWW